MPIKIRKLAIKNYEFMKSENGSSNRKIDHQIENWIKSKDHAINGSQEVIII